MAKVCEICGKGKQIGYSVSHAHNRTKREWLPNLQSIRIVKDGAAKRVSRLYEVHQEGTNREGPLSANCCSSAFRPISPPSL